MRHFLLLLTLPAFVLMGTAAPAAAQNSNDLELLHYWNFNADELEEALEPSFTIDGLDAEPIEHNFNREQDVGLSGTSTSINARFDDGAGNSLELRPGPADGDQQLNDGSHIQLELSTSGYEDIDLKYATRRTSTGFEIQRIKYRVGDDAGEFSLVEEIDVADVFDDQEFGLISVSIDEPAVNDAAKVFIRIVFDEAVSGFGRSNVDNITVEGVPIDEEPDEGLIANIDKDTWHDTIQEAIDEADAGNTLEVSASTFEESVTIDRSLTIRGADGTEREDIIIGGVADACHDVDVTADDVFIEGVTVQGAPGSGCDASEAVIRALQVSGLSITDVAVEGPGVASEKIGINLFDSDGVTISDASVTGSGKDGINVRSRDVTLENVTATGNAIDRIGFGGIGVYASDASGANPEVSVTFAGSITLDDNPNGLILNATDDAITATTDGADFSFDGVTFWPLTTAGDVTVDNGTPDAFAAGLGVVAKATFASLAPANFALYTFEVDNAVALVSQADDPGSGLVAEDATVFDIDDEEFFVGQLSPAQSMSIQTALDAADAGATINVMPGTYEETATSEKAVFINKDDINLRSTEGRSVTTIDAGARTNGVAIGPFEGEGPHPTDVTVEGFGVENWDERGIAQRNGDGRVFIRNNFILNENKTSRNGINLSGGTGSEVTGNVIETVSFDEEDWSGTGILLTGSIDAIVEGNEVTGADIGIAIAGFPAWESLDPTWVYAEGNELTDNILQENSTGIALQNDVRSTSVKDNEIASNDARGLILQQFESLGDSPPSNTVVESNTFEEIPQHIRFSAGDGLTVQENDFFSGTLEDTFYLVDLTKELDLFAIKDANSFDLAAIVSEFDEANVIEPGEIVDCPAPEFVQDTSTADEEGFITVTFDSAEGIVEVNFVNPEDEDALTNFEASTEEDFSSDDGIRWSFNGEDTDAPASVDFILTAIPPDDVEPGDPFTASYFAQAENSCGSVIDVDPVLTLSTDPAEAFALMGNYPNPFAESTTIEFSLPEPADVQLHVFDLMGRVVATLIDDHVRAGTHEVRWDGSINGGPQAASGIYIIRLQAGDQQMTRRITRVR